MDSTNPYSQSPGFVNLLTSQLVNESYSPSIELGSSEVPLFSSQCSDDPSLGVEERKERRKWTPKEDVVLISAWLNTSKDPVIGNQQKASIFWKRIQGYFNASPQLLGEQKREASHCKQRWGRINDQVCKFVGCYEAALKDQSSGQNEDDVMKAAHEIFYNDHLIKFTLDHAWRELRHDQKWCSTSCGKVGARFKRRKLEASSAQSSSYQPESNGEDVSMGRPPGVKASKKAAKRNGYKPTGAKEEGKDLLELQSMWEIKQKDLEIKEKLSKNKLLDSLLARTDPLSDLEMALKTKLITDMLS